MPLQFRGGQRNFGGCPRECIAVKARTQWIRVLPAVVLMIGCARDLQNTRMTTGITEPTVMKSTLREKIPDRTTLAEAKDFMEREGFECSIKRNGSFSEEGVSRDGIDYLYCDRHDRVDTWVSRRWQIALVLKDGTVNDVYVSQGLIGP